MKKLLLPIALATVLFSCNNKEEKGKFTVNGELKNVSDQKVYLEELFFNTKKAPEVLDTSLVQNGKFSISATAQEQGMYRIRLEKDTVGFIFINDQPVLQFTTDGKNFNGEATWFSGPANASLKKFLADLREQRLELTGLFKKLSDARADKDNPAKNMDSIIMADSAQADMLISRNKQWVVKYIDTTTSPVIALFAFGVVKDKIEPQFLEKAVANLPNRFPNHQAVAMVSAEFKTKLLQAKTAEAEKLAQQTTEEPVTKNGIPGVGSMAPDITMNDVNDKPFSLSELRGKYVLVDFWASWCGPCRGENPNVVAAYNKFKGRNFTVLGVSLDADKADWMEAIVKDKLTWKQISDLKEWECAAVALYGISGIPYNVLVDPQGKIVATDLRGGQLFTTLETMLK